MEVTLNNSTIVIEKGCLTKLLKYIHPSENTIIISDTNVPGVLKQKVLSQFPNAHLFEVQSGEDNKNFTNYQNILSELLRLKFSRSDTIVALGGGVICDLAGFVAATYKRGCQFISIPTTTLSQIDASVGGKVGINFENLKNSVGSFYPATFVFVDVETLKTLPKRHFYNGLVEGLKAGMLGDVNLYQLFLKGNFEEDLEKIIELSILYKKKIVEEDPTEKGIRKLLNYGHTIGHALESAYHMDEYYHGECVAHGILWMSKNKPFEKEVQSILERMQIPTIEMKDMSKYLKYIENDKKVEGSTITIATVDEIGKGYLKQINLDDLFN